MFDQAGMLRELVKWDYELRVPEEVNAVIDRALTISQSDIPGAVYLSIPREVLAAPATPTSAPRRIAPTGVAYPDPQQIEQAAEILMMAENPLIITSDVGKSIAAAESLAELADKYAIPVITHVPRYLCIGNDHSMHLDYEASPHLAEHLLMPKVLRKAASDPLKNSLCVPDGDSLQEQILENLLELSDLYRLGHELINQRGRLLLEVRQYLRDPLVGQQLGRVGCNAILQVESDSGGRTHQLATRLMGLFLHGVRNPETRTIGEVNGGLKIKGQLSRAGRTLLILLQREAASGNDPPGSKPGPAKSETVFPGACLLYTSPSPRDRG